MDLQMFDYFIRVAKEQSLSKAAEKLFISQPALSKRMKNLEVFLGFRVFRRTSRGIELTEKGEGLYWDLDPHFTQIHQNIGKHMDRKAINIGCTPETSIYYLSDHYQEMKTANVMIKKVTDDDQAFIPLLLDTEIDAAIIQDISQHKHLYSHFLFEDPFFAAIPVEHPLAGQEAVTIDECLGETLIVPPTDTPLYKQITQIAEHKKIQPKEWIETSWQNIIGFVAAGAGIAFSPGIMATHIEHRGIRFLPLHDYTLSRNLYLFAVNQTILNILVYKLSVG